MSMRLGIVAEFSDRASKRMKKLVRANQRMEKLNKANTKLAKSQTTQAKANVAAQSNLANQVSRTNRLMSALKSAASGIAGTIGRAVSAMARFTGSISTAIRKVFSLKAALSRVRRGAGMIGAGAGKMARGAMVGAGLAMGATATAAGAANMVIGPAAQMEKYQTILETTMGSLAKAKEGMAWVTDFAVRTPYELQDVMASFVQLRNYGLDPTNGLLKTLGDTSAAMGKPIMQAVEAMADAVTGENERLKEFGIKAKKAGKYFYYEYTQNGVTKVAKALASDRAAIQKTLSGIFDVKYSGAMEKLSKTWEGLINNLNDMWFKFRLMIADSGVFEWAKGKVQGLLNVINQMEANGNLLTVAKEIGNNIIATLEAAWTFGTELWAVMKDVGSWLKFAADALGGWNRLVGVFIALPLLGTIAGIITGFAQLVGGLMLLGSGIAVLSLPVVAVIAGVGALAAAAYLIYHNWDAVVVWFGGLWDWIVEKASNAWNWFKENLSWHPLAIIANNWGAITDWFSGFWESLKSKAAEGWEGIKSLLKWHPVALIVNNWSEISDWFSSFWKTLKSKAVAGWESIKSTFSFEWPKIPLPELPDLGGMIDSMADKAGAAWNRVTSLFSSDDPVTIAARDPASIERAQAAAQGLKSSLEAVSAVDVSPSMSKLDQVRDQANELPSIAQTAIERVRSVLAAIDFSYHGGRLMETIAAGMRAKAHVLVTEMRKVTQTLRDHLPSSPAKLGPLSDIHRLKFGETIAQSIKPAPMVKAMRKAAAATMVAASMGSPAVAGPGFQGLAASAPTAITPSPAAVGASGKPSEASNRSGGVNIELNFAPSISVGEGAALSEEQIVDILYDRVDDLKDMLLKAIREDGRHDFGSQ